MLFANRPPSVGMPRARAALAEALRLGPEIAEVHAANGNFLSAFAWDWAEGERELERAVELDPGNATARLYLALALLSQARFEEAIEVATRALTIDPLSPVLGMALGRAHLHARRPQLAIPPLQSAIEMAPGLVLAHQELGHALLLAGRREEALGAFRHAASLHPATALGDLAYGLAVTGDPAGAEQALQDLLATGTGSYLAPFGPALAYAGLGDRDAAFDWLERGYAEHAARMNTLRIAVPFDSLRTDPRWGHLLHRMGLEPAAAPPLPGA